MMDEFPKPESWQPEVKGNAWVWVFQRIKLKSCFWLMNLNQFGTCDFIILVWISSWSYGTLRTWRVGDLLRIAKNKHLTLRKLAWDFKVKDKQLRFITPIMRSVVITCPSRILLLIHYNWIPKMKSWFLTRTPKSTGLKMRILLEYIMFLSIFTLTHGKCRENLLKSHWQGWVNFY